MNDFCEGEAYDDLLLPGFDISEKRTAQVLFGRTEVRRMPIIPAEEALKKLKEKPYVYQEFPRVMYHVKHEPKTVYNTKEKEEALADGWKLSLGEIKVEDRFMERITALEIALTDAIREFEEQTGEDYEEVLVKRERAKRIDE